MPEKRWVLKRVSNEIYCSSSGHHFIRVSYQVAGERRAGDYCFEVNSLSGKKTPSLILPKYFERDIKRAAHELLTNGKPVYHEYDRDGNKRYEELRYHYDDWAAWMTGCLAKEL